MTQNHQDDPPPAGNSWIIADLIFGIIAWFIALITNNGDGRGNKALIGCVFWLLATGGLFVMCSSPAA